MANSLSVMEGSVKELLRHQYELQVNLSTENIGIYLMSEMHFIKEYFIRLKNYITYCTIHSENTPGGGSVIMTRNNIK
jgi:hypothetical protein